MRLSPSSTLVALSLLCATSGGILTACGSSDEESTDDSNLLDRDRARGRATIHFPATTAGKPDELCVLPKRMKGANYKKDDDKDEAELCSYSFFGTKPRETSAPFKEVALCPKLSSTNPGTDVHALLDGKTRQQTEDAICKLADRPTTHLAKYKQSITCSYTPSILGYYHLSRAFGGLGDVKPAVIRTMDLPEHKAIVSEALTILKNQPNDSYPKVSWLSFQKAESDPATSKYKDSIFTTDLTQVYGGLQVNARGEDKYAGLNVRGAAPNFHSKFVQTSAYQRLLNTADVSAIAGTTMAASAQTIIQMQDISDMLLIDFLMSQQDRFGNIHSMQYYYYSKDGKIERVKKSKVDDGSTPMPAGGVLVTKMLLKDNDCGGPTKSNIVKTAKLLDQLRHMSPATYKNLRWLAQNFGSNTEIPLFMVTEATFGQKDIDMLRANLAEASTILYNSCKAGKLKLDLDLAANIAGTGKHNPAWCELAEPAQAVPVAASGE
ncbi:MAG: hypothetical protein U0174_03880 [Polyangiaceae bacterium]